MSIRPILVAGCFALLTACGGGSDGGMTPPTTLARTVPAFAATLSFDSPVFITAIPGTTQLAVVSQGGVIHAVEDSPTANTMTTLLDITSRVSSGGETGLLGLAFDPDYANNGYIYVDYTAAGPLHTVIARFHVNAGVGDPASETILLSFDQPFSNHNGGMLAFGPDGKLYVASGDGGSGNDPQDNGQNLGVLLGKLLRLTTTPGAVVPADNPFVATAGARGEVWAYGLRNPWRFSFDRANGDLWIGDVGQDAIEEIDLGVAGANYGWRVFEGSRSNINPGGLPLSNFNAPVFEYDHGQGESITGGFVYRGNAIPALAGRYVYGDFISGKVWALTLAGTTAVGNTLITTVSNPSSFGETASGEILICGYGGQVLRLVPP